ncbi:hypothetical protein AB0M54_47815 [Actinoplanes sp. NPDC051470]|uniref:hypothetical protein n=1 Tax=Actinoplanes sp. NPDC051470 TaxID=3157224 RepID=UPI00343498AF
MSNIDVAMKTSAVVTSAVQCLAAERSNESSPHYAAHVEYSDELLALAARDLVRSIDALPPSERPIGWDDE